MSNKTSPEDRNIHEKPGHLIRRLQQIAVALFMTETKSFDVTPVQYAALLAVSLHPGIDQTSLVNIIAFDRSTIGDVVARLISKRLIKRTRGEQDGRTKVLHITSLGEQLLRHIEPRVRAAQRNILAPLTTAEKAAFMKMLAKLVNLNNERSRAPRRSQGERGRRPENSKAGSSIIPG
jgi:DNA-binding MarR family transcriptional regulator